MQKKIHHINTGILFIAIFSLTQQHPFPTCHTSTLPVPNYKAQPISNETDFFWYYFFCSKTKKNT